MDDKKLLQKIENLEKRVTLLEKELEMISQISQSEKLKEYIANAERARKIALLLDESNKTEDIQENISEGSKAGNISDVVEHILSNSGINEAKQYVQKTEFSVKEDTDRYHELIKQYDWDAIFEYVEKEGNVVICNYAGFDDIETIVIPEKINGRKVTEIGEGAFRNCKNIKEVILPKSILIIGEEAFSGCGLEKINIPNGVTMIREKAFQYSQLKSIFIPPTLRKIERGTFWHTPLEKIIISEGISEIQEGAFAFCKSLKKIDLPQSVEVIGKEVFHAIGEIGNIRSKTNVYVRLAKNIREIYGMANSNIFGGIGCDTRRVTIFCEPGTIAMNYARKYSIPLKRYEEFDLLEE